MLEFDNGKSIIHYPGVQFGPFGLIPIEFGGGNLFRCIWAPSRMITFTFPEWSPTASMYHGPLALHPIGEKWIIEKWLPPSEIYRGPAADWAKDPDCVGMGPYPSKGDYVIAEPLRQDPEHTNFEKLIAWIQAGKRYSSAENALAIQSNVEAGQKERRQMRKDMIQNALRPFGGEAFAAAGGSRGTKTVDLKYTTKDLGLPTKGMAVTPQHRPVVYEIPNAGEN